MQIQAFGAPTEGNQTSMHKMSWTFTSRTLHAQNICSTSKLYRGWLILTQLTRLYSSVCSGDLVTSELKPFSVTYFLIYSLYVQYAYCKGKRVYNCSKRPHLKGGCHKERRDALNYILSNSVLITSQFQAVCPGRHSMLNSVVHSKWQKKLERNVLNRSLSHLFAPG